MRTQHQTERGLTYYEKAIEEARNENEASLVQELKLKKDLEEARDELYHGEKKAARRLLESITKKATQDLQGYTLKAKYLLEDC
jgi:vacuolar-type H+-ATPase subunit H